MIFLLIKRYVEVRDALRELVEISSVSTIGFAASSLPRRKPVKLVRLRAYNYLTDAQIDKNISEACTLLRLVAANEHDFRSQDLHTAHRLYQNVHHYIENVSYEELKTL